MNIKRSRRLSESGRSIPEQNWPLFNQATSKFQSQQRHANLATIVCVGLGKPGQDASVMVQALDALFESIILVDDILDEDEGLHDEVGVGQVSNLALALQAHSIATIDESNYPAETKYRAICCLNRTALDTAYGQAKDTTETIVTEEAYWQNARGKSTPFFAAAFYLGGLAAGASESVCACLREVGVIYGETVQVSDDLNDCITAASAEDWQLDSHSLPVLYARIVEHPERNRFLKLQQQMNEPNIDPAVHDALLEDACGILIRSGAVAYCLDQMIRRYWQTIALLKSIALDETQTIKKWLKDSYIDPINHILRLAGVEEPEIIWQCEVE